MRGTSEISFRVFGSIFTNDFNSFDSQWFFLTRIHFLVLPNSQYDHIGVCWRFSIMVTPIFLQIFKDQGKNSKEFWFKFFLLCTKNVFKIWDCNTMLPFRVKICLFYIISELNCWPMFMFWLFFSCS